MGMGSVFVRFVGVGAVFGASFICCTAHAEPSGAPLSFDAVEAREMVAAHGGEIAARALERYVECGEPWELFWLKTGNVAEAEKVLGDIMAAAERKAGMGDAASMALISFYRTTVLGDQAGAVEYMLRAVKGGFPSPLGKIYADDFGSPEYFERFLSKADETDAAFAYSALFNFFLLVGNPEKAAETAKLLARNFPSRAPLAVGMLAGLDCKFPGGGFGDAAFEEACAAARSGSPKGLAALYVVLKKRGDSAGAAGVLEKLESEAGKALAAEIIMYSPPNSDGYFVAGLAERAVGLGNARLGLEMAFEVSGEENFYGVDWKARADREAVLKLLKEAFFAGKWEAASMISFIYASAGNHEAAAQWSINAAEFEDGGLEEIYLGLLLGGEGFPRDAGLAQKYLERIGSGRAVLRVAAARTFAFDGAGLERAAGLLASAWRAGARVTVAEVLDFRGGNVRLIAEMMRILPEAFAPDAFERGLDLASKGDWSGAAAAFSSDETSPECAAMLYALMFCGKTDPAAPAEDLQKALERAVLMMKNPLLPGVIGSFPERVVEVFQDPELFGGSGALWSLAGAYAAKECQTASADQLNSLLFPPFADGNSAGFRAFLDGLEKGGWAWRDMKENLMHVYDAGGPVPDRKRWLHCAEAVYADSLESDEMRYQDVVELEYPMSFFNGPEPDRQRAVELLSKQGSRPLSMLVLAYCSEYGLGTEKNPQKADEIIAKFMRLFGEDAETYVSIWRNDGRFGKFGLKTRGAFVSKLILECAERSGDYTEAALEIENAGGPLEKALEYYMKSFDATPYAMCRAVELMRENESLMDPAKYFDMVSGWFASSGMPDEMRAKADLSMAGCLLNGVGAERNPEGAVKILEGMHARFGKADADRTIAAAVELLAYCREKGIGCEKDSAAAEKLRGEILTRASMCRMENPNCSLCYDFYSQFREYYYSNPPHIFPQDRQKGDEMGELSMEMFPSASNMSREFLRYSRTPAGRDWKKALKILDRLGEIDESHWYQYRKGYITLHGAGCEKNPAKGIELLEKSASENYPYAMEYLSYVYARGILGVERDAEKAGKWLNRFLSAKEPPFVEIANRYLRASDMIKDAERSKFILELGAEAGDAACKEHLKDFEAFARRSLSEGEGI